MTISQTMRRTDTKRGKYAISVDPFVVRQVDALVDTGFLRSRSHGVEEALRMYLAHNKDRLPEDDGGNELEAVPA